MWNPKVFTAEEEADSISENTISEEKLVLIYRVVISCAPYLISYPFSCDD